MKKLYKINQFTAAEWDGIEYDWNEHEDEILIIEKKNAYCMDITANGKRIVPILRKIEEAMTAAGLAGESGIFAGWFGEWANSLTDRIERKYFIWDYSGRSDIERGCWSYSWGIEQIDEDRWYIFLNIAKPAEAPQEAPAAEAEQQPTPTEEAPKAATQAAEGTAQQADDITAAMIDAMTAPAPAQTVTVTWANGTRATYSADMLGMLRTDPAALDIQDDDTGELIYIKPDTEETTTDEKKEENNTMSTTEREATATETATVAGIIRRQGGYRERIILLAPHTMTHGETWNAAHKVVNVLESKPGPDGYRAGCAVDIVTHAIVG